MNLYQCQEKAKDIGFDKATFDAHFPTGIKQCKWIDAYFGLFKINDGSMDNKFLSVRQIAEMFPDLVCENLESSQPTGER